MLDIPPTSYKNGTMSTHQSYSGKVIMDTSAPSNPVQGQTYYNSSTHVLWRYDGTIWRGAAFYDTSTSTSSSTSTTTTSTSTTTTTTSTSTTITTSTSTTTSTTTTG